MHAHRAFATAWLIALSLPSRDRVAQQNDCEDVDHDCGADPTVSRGSGGVRPSSVPACGNRSL